MASLQPLSTSLHGDRCIAGIEISTGKWIRPVTNLEFGQVPKEMCLVDGEEPKLLDILEIPLIDTCFGYELENRLYLAIEKLEAIN
ncbi:dual OB domain-containing protein [Fischerella thermalis]|uniref:dual OB domain-containing protein n=1 Tax=Fischerella thermalis TaxID=372787 RepID=UPI003B969080